VGKAVVSQNEQVPIRFAMHNASNTALSGLRTVVTQHVRWQAGTHSAATSMVVAEASYDPSLSPGATPGPMTAQDKSKAGRVSTRKAAQKQVVERLQFGEGQSGLLHILPGALDSYQGQLISVSHSVAVIGTTPGTCTTNPQISQQIFIQPSLGVGEQLEAVDPVTHQPTYAGAEAVQATGTPWATTGWNPTAAPTYEVVMGNAIMGGAASAPVESDVDPPDYGVFSATAAPAPPPATRGYSALISELDASYDDVGAIQRFVNDPVGGTLLRQITPHQFGEIISKVDFSLDQPRAAKILSDNAMPGITTNHLIAALKMLPQGSLGRVDIVRDLGPICTDIAQNKAALKQHVSDFEAILCGAVFT
jgi:hypothetical protein